MKLQFRLLQNKTRLINAEENDGDFESGVADLNVNIISDPSPDERTVAFVDNNSEIINMYKEFIQPLTIAELAGNFAHEWTHLMGFKHPVDTGKNHGFLLGTIPYAVQEIATKYVNQRFLDFALV